MKISPTQTKAPKQACFLSARAASARLSIQPPWGFFKRHHCSTLIVVVLFVRVQAGPGRGGGIKKKKGQFDGCLLISRPLGLWLPNIKPAITGQSSHLHLHTPSSRIGSNWLFLSVTFSLILSLCLCLSLSRYLALFSSLLTCLLADIDPGWSIVSSSHPHRIDGIISERGDGGSDGERERMIGRWNFSVRG